MQARRTGLWTGRYDLITDGRRVATWEKSLGRAGGTLEIDGRRYVVRSDPWGRTCSMVGPDGAQVATACNSVRPADLDR